MIERYRSNAEAAKWYRLAADNGHVEAQFKLGLYYMRVWGNDEVEAAKWLSKASEKGHEDASDNLKRLQYTSHAGSGSTRLDIRSTPPETKFYAFSSSGVVYEGLTPFHGENLPNNVERICFQRKGYEPFYKKYDAWGSLEVTLRQLPKTDNEDQFFGTRSQPTCGLWTSEDERRAEEKEQKKKWDDYMYWARLETTKAQTTASRRSNQDRNTASSHQSSPAISTVSQPSTNPGFIDASTGQYYPGVAGGAIDPRNGTFYQKVGGGYINTQSGQFVPAP